MQNKLLLDELRDLLQHGRIGPLRRLCDGVNPAVVAEAAGHLRVKEIRRMLHWLTPWQRARLFRHFEPDLQLALVELFDEPLSARMLADLPEAKRERLLNELPPDQAGRFRRTIAVLAAGHSPVSAMSDRDADRSMLTRLLRAPMAIFPSRGTGNTVGA